MPNRFYQRNNVPGIPRAPVVRFFHPCDREFERVKEKSNLRLPFLDRQEIIRYRKPHKALFQQLLADGYHLVVEEILYMKEMEEAEVGNCLRKESIVINNFVLLARIAEVFRACVDNNQKSIEDFFASACMRYDLGQDLLVVGDYWLCKHFFQTALSLAARVNEEESVEFQAKVHCLLAYMERMAFKKSRSITWETIEHLEESRRLCKGKEWWFHQKLMDVSIRKPVAVYGIREEVVKVNCQTQSMYNVVTILFLNILMEMVQRTMSSVHEPTFHEFRISLKLSFQALLLAEEIRNPTAVLSALVLHGVLLRDCGNFKRASGYFQRLLQEGELSKDFEAQAIAYSNIAFCFQGLRSPLEALSCLELQKALCEEKRLLELEADSVERTGHILLQEGHAVEAEQSFYNAYNDLLEATPQLVSTLSMPSMTMSSTRLLKHKSSLKQAKVNVTQEGGAKNVRLKSPPEDMGGTRKRSEEVVEVNWAFAGIAAGQHLWGRFAGHGRQSEGNVRNLHELLKFKEKRTPMLKVPKPVFQLWKIQDVFEEYDGKMVPVFRVDDKVVPGVGVLGSVMRIGEANAEREEGVASELDGDKRSGKREEETGGVRKRSWMRSQSRKSSAGSWESVGSDESEPKYTSDARLGEWRKSQINSRVKLMGKMVKAGRSFLGRSLFPSTKHGGLSKSQRSFTSYGVLEEADGRSANESPTVVSRSASKATPKQSVAFASGSGLDANDKDSRQPSFGTGSEPDTEAIKEFRSRMGTLAKVSIAPHSHSNVKMPLPLPKAHFHST